MSKKTLKEYRNIARSHLLPVLGMMRVKTITKHDIEAVAKRMVFLLACEMVARILGLP